MDTSIRPPMIGISGITNANSRHEIASYIKPPEKRPLCITVNLTTNTIRRGVPSLDDSRYLRRTALKEVFIDSIPNVVNLVQCVRESVVDDFPSGETLKRAMDIAGIHCHGIRLSLDDATTDALIEFRKMAPRAIIALNVTSTAFRSRCGGNEHTLCKLFSGYTEKDDEQLVDYVYIEVDERKGMSGFPLKQGLHLLNTLTSQRDIHCRFGISGSINESVLGLLPSMIHDWEKVCIDGGEALREAKTGVLLIDRVHTFLSSSYDVFHTHSR